MTHGNRANVSSEAEFRFGYFYRTIEEHINAFAEEAGHPFTVEQIAARICRVLSGKILRRTTGTSELVSKMRQNGSTVGAGARNAAQFNSSRANIHVRPRHREPLSKAARLRIAAAQRARWAKLKRKQRGSMPARTRAKLRAAQKRIWAEKKKNASVRLATAATA